MITCVRWGRGHLLVSGRNGLFYKDDFRSFFWEGYSHEIFKNLFFCHQTSPQSHWFHIQKLFVQMTANSRRYFLLNSLLTALSQNSVISLRPPGQKLICAAHIANSVKVKFCWQTSAVALQCHWHRWVTLDTTALSNFKRLSFFWRHNYTKSNYDELSCQRSEGPSIKTMVA